MTKQILMDYVDACELLEEIEADIKRLNRKKTTVIQTNVKGSNPNFPYQPQHFKVAGTPFSYADDSALRYEEKRLRDQKSNVDKIKRQVEEWLLTIPVRMQRIIRMKYFEELTWEEVALRMGRKATADGIRKEFERFFEK